MVPVTDNLGHQRINRTFEITGDLCITFLVADLADSDLERNLLLGHCLHLDYVAAISLQAMLLALLFLFLLIVVDSMQLVK